jgi:hypothetical protein
MFRESNIKAVLAVLVVSALVVGFFMSLITAEAFLPIATFIVQYYFHRNDMKVMQEKIDEKDGQIQALANGTARIINLPNE